MASPPRKRHVDDSRPVGGLTHGLLIRCASEDGDSDPGRRAAAVCAGLALTPGHSLPPSREASQNHFFAHIERGRADNRAECAQDPLIVTLGGWRPKSLGDRRPWAQVWVSAVCHSLGIAMPSPIGVSHHLGVKTRKLPCAGVRTAFVWRRFSRGSGLVGGRWEIWHGCARPRRRADASAHHTRGSRGGLEHTGSRQTRGQPSPM
jgi:hypothetical protein